MQLQWSFLGRTVNTPIVDFRKPPSRDFIEMLHRSKRSAIDSAATFMGEIEMVCRPVHLSLNARSSFESDRCRFWLEPMSFDEATNDRVLAIEAKILKLLQRPLCRDARISDRSPPLRTHVGDKSQDRRRDRSSLTR